MILPPTGVDPIAGSGIAPYFRKRKKSLVRCALRTASDWVYGRTISPPSASDAATALPVAEFGPKSATSAVPGRGTRLAKLMPAASFGTVRLCVFCHHGCASLLDGRPGQTPAGRAGVPQPAPGPHRGADHVAHWPPGLRGPRAGMARFRLLGGSGDAARAEVEEPAGPHRAAASRSGAAVHELAGEPVRRGTSSFHSACARLSGTSAMGSNGLAWVRNRRVPGSGALGLTA